ncbi:MAG: immunity 49 family protein [Gemmataceae bacterium]|nr:immunity 49 family protein [Gemmataceae bacterium]MCI0738269.1 immunity 49 family protein [Gemmataceae bacterium]
MLPIIIENAEFELDVLLSTVVDGRASHHEVLVFCHDFRLRGICSLFLDGVPEQLHNDLQRSGRAFLHFLRSADEAKKITSKAEPFFDAIACKDLDGAAEIAHLSRHTWNKEEEYEDDFLYVHFLIMLFFLKATDDELRSILKRYVEVLEGGEDIRLDICSALLEKNEEQFDAALSALLAERQNRVRERVLKDTILEEEAVTVGRFSIEGLALLNLAEIRGLATGEEYPLVPSVARRGFPKKFDAEAWKQF